MLRKIRITVAVIFFAAITLLFLDISGVLHTYLGWLAKIQFLPAVMALNVAVIVGLVLLTLLFGRVYCSVICPLGVFQDGVSWLSARRKGKKARFTYSKEIKWLRYGVLALFIICLIAGIHFIVSLLAPYSSYGRFVQNLFSPVYHWINNLLAYFSERSGSYAFVTKEVWIRSLPTFIIAAATFVIIIILAWKGGRTYCNAICPVGTTLSFFSRFAMFRPMIDSSKCKKCHSCEKHCKARCISIQKDSQKIDYSRCVDCFDCLDNCKFGALKYRFAWGKNSSEPVPAEAPAAKPAASEPESKPTEAPADNSRRAFMIGGALALGGTAISTVANAQRRSSRDSAYFASIKLDGGYADIIPKQIPPRTTPITPFGSRSVKLFYQHCTACQLCVSVCPNNVLRPSKSLDHLMQPEMSFERGYCRPECTKCSEVCPTGAILKITPEEKTTWKVGTSHINLDLCVVNRDGVNCGNCARHCPVGAIMMVHKDKDDNESLMIPTVNEEKCIGCGACENLCPSRPISAITVDGNEVHHAN
jgi:ferredoxin